MSLTNITKKHVSDESLGTLGSDAYVDLNTISFSLIGSEFVSPNEYYNANSYFSFSGVVKDASFTINLAKVSFGYTEGDGSLSYTEYQDYTPVNQSKSSLNLPSIKIPTSYCTPNRKITHIKIAFGAKPGLTYWAKNHVVLISFNSIVIQNYYQTERYREDKYDITLKSYDHMGAECPYFYDKLVCKWKASEGEKGFNIFNTSAKVNHYYTAFELPIIGAGGTKRYYFNFSAKTNKSGHLDEQEENTNNLNANQKILYNLVYDSSTKYYILTLTFGTERVLCYSEMSIEIYPQTNFQQDDDRPHWTGNSVSRKAVDNWVEELRISDSYTYHRAVASLVDANGKETGYKFRINNPKESSTPLYFLLDYTNPNNYKLDFMQNSAIIKKAQVIFIINNITVRTEWVDLDWIYTGKHPQFANWTNQKISFSISEESLKQLFLKTQNWNSKWTGEDGDWLGNISFKLYLVDVYDCSYETVTQYTINDVVQLRENLLFNHNYFRKIEIWGVEETETPEFKGEPYETTILNPGESFSFSVDTDSVTSLNDLNINYKLQYYITSEKFTTINASVLSKAYKTNFNFMANGNILYFKPNFTHHKTEYLYFSVLPQEMDGQVVTSVGEEQFYPMAFRIGRVQSPILDLCSTDLTNLTYRFSDNGSDRNLDINKYYSDYMANDYSGTSFTRMGTEWLELTLADSSGNPYKKEDNSPLFYKVIAITSSDNAIEIRKLLMENQKKSFELMEDGNFSEEEKQILKDYSNQHKLFFRGRYFYSGKYLPFSEDSSPSPDLSLPKGAIQFIKEVTLTIGGPTVGYRGNSVIINPTPNQEAQAEEVIRIQLTPSQNTITLEKEGTIAKIYYAEDLNGSSGFYLDENFRIVCDNDKGYTTLGDLALLMGIVGQ